MSARIAIGGIHTECATGSPLVQGLADFTTVTGSDLAGSLGIAAPDNVRLVPLAHYRSIPGGPVAADAYQALKDDFLSRLERALPVDGVFLAMHGAMHVPGVDDAEADWIEAVRDLAGPNIPITASYDLHGNLSQRIVDAIDMISAYRTAPHIDVAQTHARALNMLADTLERGTRRMVAWVPVPVLMPGERTSTECEPARSLYARLADFDGRDGICEASLLVGYVWADEARATAAAVVTGTDADAIMQCAGDLAQAWWDERRNFDFGVPAGSLDWCLDQAARAETGPVILADSGDNPTAGGVGDRSDVLAAILRRGMTGAVVAGIADAPAALACARAGGGASLRVDIGGTLGGGQPVSCMARVARITGSEKAGDLEAVVQVAGNRVVLGQRRRPYHHLEDFRRLGIEPEAARIIVVKSGYLSPQLAPIARPALMALTGGAVAQDIAALPNRHRKRPVFPFDQNFDWQPEPRLSARAAIRTVAG